VILEGREYLFHVMKPWFAGVMLLEHEQLERRDFIPRMAFGSA